MKIGIFSVLVVDKYSAVLGHGYRKERVQYLDANHQGMCKFDSLNDPNYIRVRNALCSAVEDLSKDALIDKANEDRKQLKGLELLLGVTDIPNEEHPKVSGSCQWINAREDFRSWRVFPKELLTERRPERRPETYSKNLSIFWIHANPGTGKTFLASHVISHLQDFRLECANYFFHFGDESSRSIGTFLRSIAYQMAISNPTIRNTLTNMRQEDAAFDMNDLHSVWTKVFQTGIFQAPVCTPQYWVIDALDECSNYQELVTMLKGARPSFPLRIFITSRNVHDIYLLQKHLESSAVLDSIEIPVQETLCDIQFYIRSQIGNLPIANTVDKEEWVTKILRKSHASFLWVRLIIEDLENVYSIESMMKILEGVPEGMKDDFNRTIKSIAANEHKKHIAKAILKWIVASARKLTISELSQALKLDIDIVLPNARKTVESLCQLVSVNNESDVVDFIHPTAYEFLVSSAGEFTISKTQANERLAMVCLQLLCSNELRPPRNHRFLTPSRPKTSPLLEYAITQFSEHLYLASSENDNLLEMVDRFFKTNALPWIERLALKGNLYSLISASKNLKAYLDRMAKHESLSSQINRIYNWSIDLSRLVTQFGKALLQDPLSIHFLIPPLCPSSSAIYQQFGKRPDGLSLVGSQTSSWDDCIANVHFGDDLAVAISCGESLIAVGMGSGDVNIYNRNYEEEAVIHHSDPVDLVHLSDDIIASCTTRSIEVKDLTGKTIWDKRLRFRCLLLTSSSDLIVAVSQHGHLLKWDRRTGDQIEDQEYPYRNFDVETEHNGLAFRVPQVVTISFDMEMVALGYRGGTVCLWDIREKEFVSWARDDAGRLATALLFNPNPNTNLLLIIYTDNGISLYDTWSGDLIQSQSTSNYGRLLSASCSPDGRTLATIDSLGNMLIRDFDSLSILYQTYSPMHSFRLLNFTSDGSSIVEVMDSSMRIWSPAVLVHKKTEEDHITSQAIAKSYMTEGNYEFRKSKKITVLCQHPTSNTVFAGKYNGQIIAFDSKDGKAITDVCSQTHGAFITHIAVTNNAIASSDVSGVVQVWGLSPISMTTDILRAEVRTTAAVKQLCFSANGDYLLVATVKCDSVYRVADGSCVGIWSFDPEERKSWRWLLLPQCEEEEQHFSVIIDGTIRSYSALSFPQPIGNSETRLQYSLDEDGIYCEEIGIDAAVIISSTEILVIGVRYQTGFYVSSTVFLFEFSNFKVFSGGFRIDTLTPLCPLLSQRCKHFLGFSTVTKSFVFLHRDSWISSIDLSGLREKRYVRHFFVPTYDLSNNVEMLLVKTVDDDLVFCLHGELISIKNGMKFSTVEYLE